MSLFGLFPPCLLDFDSELATFFFDFGGGDSLSSMSTDFNKWLQSSLYY